MFKKKKKNQGKFAIQITSPITGKSFMGLKNANPLPSRKKAKKFMEDVVNPKFPQSQYKTKVKRLGLLDMLMLKKKRKRKR